MPDDSGDDDGFAWHTPTSHRSSTIRPRLRHTRGDNGCNYYTTRTPLLQHTPNNMTPAKTTLHGMWCGVMCAVFTRKSVIGGRFYILAGRRRWFSSTYCIIVNVVCVNMIYCMYISHTWTSFHSLSLRFNECTYITSIQRRVYGRPWAVKKKRDDLRSKNTYMDFLRQTELIILSEFYPF